MNPIFKLSTLALLVSGTALAQNETPDFTIVTTAARIPQTEQDTLASVTVITRKDIEARQLQTLPDALRTVAGVTVSNSGGLGKATSVFMRGTGSGHVLVLIDGVRADSATLGAFAFENLPIEQIDRIEVVRGPRASLYGSEAIGGVIQIFTRKGGNNAPSFSVSAGSHNTFKFNQGLSAGNDQSWFNLNLSALTSSGIDATTNRGEPDEDGYRNKSASLRAGHRYANGTSLEFHALQSDGRSEYDGSWTNLSKSQQQVVGGKLAFSPARFWNASLNLAEATDARREYKDASYRGNITTRRSTVTFQNDFSLSDRQKLSAGVDYYKDRVDSNTAYSVTSRDNLGVFAQYLAGFGQHDLALNLRSDDNQQFGQHTTGAAAWGYAVSDRLRATASYGTAFKAPTFNDLYWPYDSSTWGSTTYVSQGNVALVPEQSKTAELGLRFTPSDRLQLAASVYRTDVENLISWATVNTQTGSNAYTSTSTPAQFAQARINGVEASLRHRIGAWHVNATANLLDARDQATDKRLPRRPQSHGTLSIDHVQGKTRLGALVLAEGRRYNDVGNNERLPGFATIDLRAEYNLAAHWFAGVLLANLLDKEYQTVTGYRQDGRNYMFTLRYTPATK